MATDDAVEIHSTLSAEIVKVRPRGLTVSAETSYDGADQHVIRNVVRLSSGESLAVTLALAKPVSSYPTDLPKANPIISSPKFPAAARAIRTRLLAALAVRFTTGAPRADEGQIEFTSFSAGGVFS